MELQPTNFINVQPSKLKVMCPKHGEHSEYIESTIKDHEGYWCMLCWLESLGEPLPVVKE